MASPFDQGKEVPLVVVDATAKLTVVRLLVQEACDEAEQAERILHVDVPDLDALRSQLSQVTRLLVITEQELDEAEAQ